MKTKIFIFLFLISTSAYSQIENRIESEIYWKLPLLPIKIGYDGNGLSLSIEKSISTPLGTFGTSGTYKREVNTKREIVERIVYKDRIIEKEKIIYKDRIKEIERVVYVYEKDFTLILRKDDKDYVFIIPNYEEIAFSTHGEANFKVGNQSLLIDLTEASINDIQFRGKKYREVDFNKIVNNKTENNKTFTDERDGKYYNWIKIGDQIWMAENLAYKTNSGSWAYNNNEKHVATYGRLYDWATACEVCPDGWHLPSDSEWNELESKLGKSKIAGKKLKSSYSWDGTNIFGFNVTPSGLRYSSGNFGELGSSARFWTSTKHSNSSDLWFREFRVNNDKITRVGINKKYAFSVRCLKD